jgi:adenosine deaminase CECR1
MAGEHLLENPAPSLFSLEGFGEMLVNLYDHLLTPTGYADEEILHPHDYDKKRNEMIKRDQKDYFTFDVPYLTAKEKLAEEKLFRYRDELVQGDHSPLLLPFYDSKALIENSDIHNALKKMPKGAHLHLHPTAGFSLDLFLKFTYDDIVYYNMKMNHFEIFEDGNPTEGYMKCNDFRKNWVQNGTFDDYLRSQMLLNPEEMASQESNKIWQLFQVKFGIAGRVYKYPPYHKQLFRQMMQNAVDENIYILEMRYSFGGFSGDIDEELEFFKQIIDEFKAEHQNFELRMIVSSAKAVGKQTIVDKLQYYNYARKKYDFIVGFDLVNEEDTSPSLYQLKDLILEAKRNSTDEKSVNKFNVFFHSGESDDRYNANIFDALLMGTKRIGHGLAITKHPYLMDVVKENEIGIEV